MNYCVKSVQIRIFFWSVISPIRTEYGKIRSISPYSVWIREYTYQKILRIWTVFTQWFSSKLRPNNHILWNFKTYLSPWNFGTAIPWNAWLLWKILFSEKYVCRSVYLPYFAIIFSEDWLNTLKIKINQLEVILRHWKTVLCLMFL